MKNYFLLFLAIFLLISAFNVSAQQQQWQTEKHDQRNILTDKQYDFSLIFSSNKASSFFDLTAINLPDPNGKAVNFQLESLQVMSPELAKKYPTIKSYIGYGEDGEVVRMTVTPKGLHAMVFSNKGLYFIDPVALNSPTKYQAYYKHDLNTKSEKSRFIEAEPIVTNQQRINNATTQPTNNQSALPPTGPTLRTYRIAIAATGEYTQFHGGNVTDALAAIVTTLTRVNGIYEKELAIRMVLVDNNDELIFLDPATDPFSNGDASAYIDEVQTYLDTNIGTANYDIGHGFSTGAGGLAGLGVVCVDGRKGSGVTGTNSPIGDPYDVDYVAHELGHQFGAPHTFNGSQGSCAGGNRNPSTAYEPGSGITIMAYAGICGSDNIANNSIPYFHASSLQSISTYTQDSNGNSCPSLTETGNSFPAVEAGQGGFTIPISTPFQLNGSASDPDGDALTYSWEQFDLGPAGSPINTVGNSPLFRPFAPSADSFRIFPQISDILNSTQTIGERLPEYARDMNFILTVRDDQAVGGVNNDLISFSVSDAAGPFTVDTIAGDFVGFDEITVRWDVANTNQSPINCSKVNIYLSLDGGFTYDHLLASNSPNDGFETITLPNVSAEKAKVKVAAAENIFFNLSGSFFTIQEFQEPSFTVSALNTIQNTCLGENISFQIQTAAILNYTQPINLSIAGLPEGFTSNFSQASINPGQTSTLNLTYNGNQAIDLSFKVVAQNDDFTKTLPLSLFINEIPVKPTIIGPLNNTQAISLRPTIFWSDVNNLANYDIAIAEDAQFNSIVIARENILEKQFKPDFELASNTTYYVSLVCNNNCGQSDIAISSFTTADKTCGMLAAVDLPIAIPNTISTISSEIEVLDAGVIESIEISNIKGTHTYIADLTFTLVSPAGTRVKLLSEKCDNLNDFFFSVSDTAQSSTLPCPPTDGGTYTPAEPLANFIGESAMGIWTLEISDAYAEDGGSLDQWELNYCISGASLKPSAPTALNLAYEGNETISLHWQDNSDDETGFYVQRAKNSLDFKTIKVLNSNDTVYQEKLPSVEDIYQYRVVAFNNVGPSYSNTVQTSVLILEQVARPNGLVANYQTDTTALISWTDNADNESTYIFEADLDRNGIYEIIEMLGANANSFSLELPNLDTVNVRVKAFNKYTSSDYSPRIDFSLVSISFINAPSDLIATYIDGDTISLSWQANSLTAKRYVVESKITTEETFNEVLSLSSDSTSVKLRLPSIQQAHNYRVYATNAFWESDFSNIITASIKILAVSKSEIGGAITVYPNPATNSLSIYNPNNEKIEQLSIYTLLGSQITDVVLIDNQFDLSQLVKGIYLLTVKTENNQYTIRFLKK